MNELQKIQNKAVELLRMFEMAKGCFSNQDTKDAESLRLAGIAFADVVKGVADEIFDESDVLMMNIKSYSKCNKSYV